MRIESWLGMGWSSIEVPLTVPQYTAVPDGSSYHAAIQSAVHGDVQDAGRW